MRGWLQRTCKFPSSSRTFPFFSLFSFPSILPSTRLVNRGLALVNVSSRFSQSRLQMSTSVGSIRPSIQLSFYRNERSYLLALWSLPQFLPLLSTNNRRLRSALWFLLRLHLNVSEKELSVLLKKMFKLPLFLKTNKPSAEGKLSLNTNYHRHIILCFLFHFAT